MQNRPPLSQSIFQNNRKLAVENLKRCPLCGTVNSKASDECFVCRWHGDFDQRPDSVEEGLLDVLDHCPELLDCILQAPKRPLSPLSRMRDWLRSRVIRRRLDLEA